eukprot:535499-Amphidinium_carterae.1
MDILSIAACFKSVHGVNSDCTETKKHKSLKSVVKPLVPGHWCAANATTSPDKRHVHLHELGKVQLFSFVILVMPVLGVREDCVHRVDEPKDIHADLI